MMVGLEIVAVGARTPIGLTAESTAAAVRARIAGFGEYAWVDARGEPKVVAADAELPSQLEGRERMLALACHAIDEVLPTLEAARRAPTHVAVALPEPRPGFEPDDGGWITRGVDAHLRGRGCPAHVSAFEHGHAGAMRALEQVAQELPPNGDSCFLLVGADSHHHPSTYTWLESNRQFAGAEVRGGFVPGEGGGCLAMLKRRTRDAACPCLATVRSVSTAMEQELRDSETGTFGLGLTEAVRGAATALALPDEAVDTAFCDISGERYRSEEWGFLALRAPEVFRSLTYEAPADCWGDVGAATAVLAGVLAVEAFRKGYAPGPRTMLAAGSLSGLRGAMILESPELATTKGPRA